MRVMDWMGVSVSEEWASACQVIQLLASRLPPLLLIPTPTHRSWEAPVASMDWEDVVGHRRLVATVDLSCSPGVQHGAPGREGHWFTTRQMLPHAQASNTGQESADVWDTTTLTCRPLPCPQLVGWSRRLLRQQPERHGPAGSLCVHPRPATAPGGGAQG